MSASAGWTRFGVRWPALRAGRHAAAGLAVTACLLCAIGAGQAAELSAEAPLAADGGSLRIAGRVVRLWGMRAPPLSWRCTDRQGLPYACGARARDALQAMIGSGRVACHVRGAVPGAILLAACDAGGLDLSREMVRQGWAVAERRFEGYVADETAARAAALGLWSGTFRPPPDW